MNWYKYSTILMKKCIEKGTPYHTTFELTPFCNFRCNMCYIRLEPEQAALQGSPLKTEQWIRLAEEAKKMGILSMEVTGGEAMTRADFHILYESFIRMGFLISLRTNGYLLTKENVEFIKKNKPAKICITLYGATDETYEKVCGVPDGFTTVTRNIELLIAAGLKPQLSMTITNDNADDEPLMRKWAAAHGLELIPSRLLYTPIRGAKRSIDHLQVPKPEEEYELPDELKSLERKISEREKYMNPFWMCRLFGARFTVTWDGKMTLCNTNPEISKDVLTLGLNRAFQELYDDLRKIGRPEECRTCKYIDCCGACPSMLFSATGSMWETNDDICKLARRRFKNRVEWGTIDIGSSDLSENNCE